MAAKKRARRAARILPDENTTTEAAEEAAILRAVEQGEEDIAAGRTMTHDEVRAQRIRKAVKDMLTRRDRDGPKLSDMTIREAIEEGHRY